MKVIQTPYGSGVLKAIHHKTGVHAVILDDKQSFNDDDYVYLDEELFYQYNENPKLVHQESSSTSPSSSIINKGDCSLLLFSIYTPQNI